jgi:hypothetical protein
MFNLSHLILIWLNRVCISNNKIIASIPSTNTEFGYNLIENNIGICNFVSTFRQDTYGVDLIPGFSFSNLFYT